MKKTIWIIAVFLTLLVFSISGCTQDSKESTEKEKDTTTETSVETATETPVLGTIRYGHRASTNLLPVYVAIENGYFKENGVNLELIEIAGSSLTMKAMVAGELDAGVMSFEICTTARIAGMPVKIIASLMHKPPAQENSCFAVLKDSPYQTLQDLKGKTIAVYTRNICPWFHTMAALDEAGMVEGVDYYTKELSGATAALALQEGTVDAVAYLIDPHFTALGDNGRALFWWTDENAPCPCGHCFTEETLEGNPELVKGWVKALQEGIEYINTQNREARLILAKYLGVSEETALTCRLPGWDEQGRLFSDLAEKQLNWMQKYGMIDEIPPLEEMYDYRFTGEITLTEKYPDIYGK